jgi:hypothetical protein
VRVGLPGVHRYIGEDHVLTPFSKKKSEGKLMLCYLDDQSHQDENYLWHVEGQVRGEQLAPTQQPESRQY